MKLASGMMIALLVTGLGVAPVAADPGRGHGNEKGARSGHHDNHGRDGGRHRQDAAVAGCPPGLARKHPACVPPGQAARHYGVRKGDTLRIDDYVLVRDLSRYDLQPRPGWDYYRSDDRIYGVDRTTRQILAVLNLIDAFAN